MRRILYMATMGAATSNNRRLNAIYKRLLAAGKKPKVAIVAVMRKIVVILNTMIRTNQTWDAGRAENRTDMQRFYHYSEGHSLAASKVLSSISCVFSHSIEGAYSRLLCCQHITGAD